MDIKDHKMPCELAVDKIRFYYIIIQERVVIDKVKYLGKVEIEHASNKHKSGSNKNYPNQQKFIIWLKKLFRR